MKTDPWWAGAAAGLGELARDFASPWRSLPDLSQAIGAGPASARIARQQFRTLVRELPANLVAAAVGTFLWMFAIASLGAAGPLVWLWAMPGLVGMAGMALVVRRFRREAPPDHALRVWEVRCGRFASVTGVMWGSVGFVFPQQAREFAPYVAIGLLLVLTGSLSLFVSYRPGIAWLAPPCAVLTSAFLVLSGGVLNAAIGVGFLVAVALLIRLARVQNSLMTQAMLAAEERLVLLHELEHQRHEAEQANQAKTRFLAAVSHDLRQPMHSIALLTQAMTQRADDGTQLLGQVGASVQAMDDMLAALLEVSRVDDGSLPLRPAPVALGPLMQRLALQFDAQAQAKGIALQVEPSAAWVLTDAHALQRMLANLLANAIRYTPALGRVAVRCRTRGDRVWVQVWDSGIGIAREHRARVFEEFFQIAKAPHHSGEGLGLGLSIVQRLAQRLGHPLMLRSRLRRGSMFALGLALCTGPAGQALSVSVNAQLLDLLAGQLVLLIDDDAAALAAMQQLLLAFDCEVLAAQSTALALQLVADSLRTPDLIVSDQRLGEHDTGLDAIARVRAAVGERLPAVLVTAEIMVPRDAAQALGVAVLVKPLQAQALAAELGRVLRANP